MKTLLRYLKPLRGKISLGMSIKVLGTLFELIIPWILQYIIDIVVPTKEMNRIFFWGAMMLICAGISLVLNIIGNRVAARVTQKMTEALRHDLFQRSMHLSSAQVDAISIPSIESRLTSDTYYINNMVNMMQRMGVRAPILLLGGIAITLTLDPVLALVLILCLPPMTMVVYGISKKGFPLYTKLQESNDAMVRTVREDINGIRVIKALSKEEFEKERFAFVNDEVVAREKKASTTMAISHPLMSFFLNLGLTVVIYVGAVRVNAGIILPGKILTFTTYFTTILNAVIMVTRIFVMVSRGSASAKRIEDVLNLPVDMEVSADKGHQEKPFISFENVEFSYLKKENNVSKINFQLDRGQTLGVIGGTGSGKSTVAALLMRLYDVDSGAIFLDGKRIQSYPPEELYSKFGVVFQRDFLMADTIRNNITLGRQISDEDIWKACECAQAKEFIEALPDKLDHMLTAKGTNLSGGQKQRVLIARALAGNPEILILDDSSSALDYKTDSLMRKALFENFAKTTLVVIAQRVSSIKNADHILVLDEGKIIGSGKHEELMKSCPLYQEISISQMGGDFDATER